MITVVMQDAGEHGALTMGTRLFDENGTEIKGVTLVDLHAEPGALWRIHLEATVKVVRASDPDAPRPKGVDPIPMILYCPHCGTKHVDAPEEDRMVERLDTSEHPAMRVWDNPPHRSHLCVGCGCIWRPADVPTVGVEAIKTKGKDDTFQELTICPNPQCMHVHKDHLLQCPYCGKIRGSGATKRFVVESVEMNEQGDVTLIRVPLIEWPDWTDPLTRALRS